jgi:hypothetical protein
LWPDFWSAFWPALATEKRCTPEDINDGSQKTFRNPKDAIVRPRSGHTHSALLYIMPERKCAFFRAFQTNHEKGAA